MGGVSFFILTRTKMGYIFLISIVKKDYKKMEKSIKGLTLLEIILAMAILSILLVGLIPMFIGVMRSTARDRWETLATARTKELIEIIKRVASTDTGYATGDTNGVGGIQTTNYQELDLADFPPDHPDPDNPIVLGTGTEGIRANRWYRVVTTGVGPGSYKTITVWIKPINAPLLSSVTVQTIISPP